MNRDEAKQVLLLYRPGTRDAEDPQIEAAMAVARQDPELAAWFQQHVSFQSSVRNKLREIQVPAHFKAGLLARQKNLVVPPAAPSAAWWQQPRHALRKTLAGPLGAVMLVLVVAVALVGLNRITRPGIHPNAINRFANFKERIVGDIQRQYSMEFETSDMAQLRRKLAERGARSDYTVPKGLEPLQLTGGGVLKWQGTPVSMVCFDRGGGRMLFLFVMKREAIPDPPPQRPDLAIVHQWPTVSWSDAENAYLLAGEEQVPDPASFAKKYL